MFANEYEDEIKQKFITCNLKLSLGLKKKAYELQTSGCGFTVDIFLAYKLNPNKLCTYYHTDTIIGYVT